MKPYKLRTGLLKIIIEDKFPERMKKQAEDYYLGLHTGATDKETIERFILNPYKEPNKK